MTDIDPQQALSVSWLKEYNVKLISPKGLVAKVRLLKFLWSSLTTVKSKTERDNLVAKLVEGSSTRSIQKYRKVNWEIEANSRVKIQESDWTDDFEVLAIKTGDQAPKYSFTFSEQLTTDMIENPKLSESKREKTVIAVQERRRKLEEEMVPVEVLSEDEKIEIARQIMLEYATGLVDLTEACIRYNVRKNQFMLWLFQSPIIRTMFDEAKLILSVVHTADITRRVDELILERVTNGFSTNKRVTYSYIKGPKNKMIATESGKTEERREITLGELSQLRKILQESSSLNLGVAADEFEGLSDKEIEKLLGELKKKSGK